MSLVLRIGRWSLTFFAIEIEEVEVDFAPAMSVTSQNEISAGFQPPDPYWEDED